MTTSADSRSTMAILERRSSANSMEAVGGTAERAFDVIFAASALAVLLPLLLVIAAIIVLQDRGSPLYRQTRIGRNRVQFHCWKFRTMILNADQILAEHLQANPS